MFVTHDIEEAVYLSDRIVVMKPGAIDCTLDVPVPRPRHNAVKRTAECLDLQNMIFQRISQPSRRSKESSP
ncbi:hypothetical protein P4S72_12395 [Vibrio sp. PP-XX7]